MEFLDKPLRRIAQGGGLGNEKCWKQMGEGKGWVNESGIELVAMAGSKGGKHSKGKGKHKSKKPEPVNSNNDSEKIPNRTPDGPKNSKDKNPHPYMSSSMTTNMPRYTEKELEQFLLVKIEQSYIKAKAWLLNSGYGLAEVDRAILNAGSINDVMDIQKNILSNLLSFIEGKFEQKREASKNINELCKTVLQNLVSCTMQPDMQRADAMWLLLCRNWGTLPPTTMTSCIPSGSQGSSSHSNNEEAKKVPNKSNIGILKRVNRNPVLVSRLRHNVPILASALKAQIGAPIIKQRAIPNAGGFCTSTEGSSFMAFLRAWLENGSDDESITPELVDLVKSISSLYEEVKEHKEWAQRKVIESAKKLSTDLLELKMLRMEKESTEQLKNEQKCAEKDEALSSLKIAQIEKALRGVDCELDHLAETSRRLEAQNAEIRADMEAYTLNASESDRDMQVVMKRQRKSMKKLAEIEKQKGIFQQQCEADKQRVVQLEMELLKAEKAVEEAEIKWRQEIVEKEQMLALLDEEIKMAETQKANSRSELLKLQQKVDIDGQLALDDCRRLEDELSSLHLAYQMSDVVLEDDIFQYQSLEGTSSESGAPYEKTSHWNCMMCIDTQVDVVFLPCTHQVVCFSCYDKRCKVRGQCPYCGVHIEQSIRVYGAST